MQRSQFDPVQLQRGTEVEMEHTNKRRIAQRIAMDHLVEDPRYYEKLSTIHLDGTESENRERAIRFLESHKPGQELKIGRHLFTVWRVTGVTVWLTKGKGRKLYQLDLLSFEPPTFVVIEISGGSGESLGKPPVAKFEI